MNNLAGLITDFEKSSGTSTASFSNTIAFYKELCRRTEFASLHSLGKSAQGRKIPFVYIGDPAYNTPAKAKDSGKFILFIQNCIHPGEPEGNDATMLLIRELLSSGDIEELSKKLIILLVPIFNVDGHCRSSQYNRINQDGPELQGWRTTALNLNLNRDYLKADSIEMKSMIQFINEWNPDFFVDNHTTNGLDYQYHISYSFEKYPLIHTALDVYAHQNILPHLQQRLEENGFLHTHYIELAEKELEDGITRIAGMPRFSNGYFAIRNRFGLLVETHSLKPFPNRVASTLCINKALLEYIAAHAGEIAALQKNCEEEDKNLLGNRKTELPLAWELSEEFETESFLGINFVTVDSSITGSGVKRYTGKPIETAVKVYNKPTVTAAAYLPSAYLIPAEFYEIVDILKLHNIACNRTPNGSVYRIVRQKFTDYEFKTRSYEGRQRFSPLGLTEEAETLKTNGEYFIVEPSANNPRLIGFLLEPLSPDSFLQWGFFNAFFERKEYAEDFVFEPIAQKMYYSNKKLRFEFNRRLKDEEFVKDEAARLDFFYTHSRYFDSKEGIYPVLRVIERIK